MVSLDHIRAPQLTLAEYQEVRDLVNTIPLAAPGVLASVEVELQHIPAAHGPALIRYRDEPVSVLSKTTPSLANYPGLGTLNLYSGKKGRVRQDMIVQYVAAPVPSLHQSRRAAYRQLANERDFAVAGKKILANARRNKIKFGHEYLVIERNMPDNEHDKTATVLPEVTYSVRGTHDDFRWAEYGKTEGDWRDCPTWPLPQDIEALVNDAPVRELLPYYHMALVHVEDFRDFLVQNGADLS